MKFAPVERKMTRGVSHSGSMVNGWPTAGEEIRRYVVVPVDPLVSGDGQTRLTYPPTPLKVALSLLIDL